jgi:hypothetical protein
MLLKVLISAITLLNDSYSDSINFHLLDEEIHVKPGGTIISFDLKVKSCSENNYLLYGFNDDVESAWREEFDYCKKSIVAGLVVFVYDQKMEGVYAVVYISEDIRYKPITDEQVQQVIAEEKVRFRNSFQIIKPREPVVFGKKVDLRDFRLVPGTYYMKLLYYEGDNIINLVTEEQMAEDRKKYKAEIFEGCIGSNLIKLIVE